MCILYSKYQCKLKFLLSHFRVHVVAKTMKTPPQTIPKTTKNEVRRASKSAPQNNVATEAQKTRKSDPKWSPNGGARREHELQNGLQNGVDDPEGQLGGPRAHQRSQNAIPTHPNRAPGAPKRPQKHLKIIEKLTFGRTKNTVTRLLDMDLGTEPARNQNQRLFHP